MDLRRAWFSSPEYQNDRHNRILQVTNIPVSSRTEDAVSEFIEKVNPTRPQQIMLGRHFEELGPLLKEHAEVTEKFEILLHKYLRNQATTLTQRRPKIFPPGMKSAANCVRIDAFEYYKHRLHDLEEKIYAIRSRDDNSFRPNSSAFIQYTTIREAHAVAHQAGRTWTLRKELKTITVPKVKVCPDFDDIIWKNLAHRPSYLFMRKLIALPLVMFITIAWTLLLTVIITLTNLNYLRVSRPDLENANFFLLVLQYIVAPLSLYLLNYFVLPVILRFLTDFQGAVSQTGREKSTLQKFFGFLVYQNTYFIAISVVVQIVVVSYGQFNLWAFLQRYEEVVLLCTRAFVQSSTFYITTILVGYGAYAMEIVQGHYLIYNLFMQMFKLTPRQIYQAKKAPKFDYMIYYGSMCAPLMMSLAYCIVAPLVVPVSLLLYVIVYVVMKYQMRYVYVTEIETGGTWFEKMFSLVCFCLGLFQLVTCGAVALICWSRSSNGNGQVQTVMIGLLVPVTIGFWYGIRRILGPRAEYYTRAVAITAADLVESPVPEGDDAETPLDSSLFDPDMVSPLKKVWVESVQKPLLATVYTTAYENLNDFMTSKGLTQDSRFQFRAASRLVRLLLGKNGKTKTDRSVTRRITASEPPELQIDTETVSNSVADAGLKRTLLRTIRKASVDLYNTVKSPPSGHGDLLSEGGPSSRSPLPPAISIMTMHNAEPETESPRPLTPPEALAQELDEAFTPRTSTSSGPL